MSIRIFLVLCLWLIASAAMADTRPNFVVLFADDLGYGDLGSYGHPYIRTPNLDRLAEEGQRWTDFYVAAPVCSPSRAALLTGKLPVRTGQYGERIGVYFPNERGGFPDDEMTLAEALRDVGYRTGIFGKWHLGDAKHAWPTRHGFDEWLGIPYSNDMDWVGEPDIDEMIALSVAGETEKLNASRARRTELYAEPKAGMWNVPMLASKRTASGYEDKVVARPADQALTTHDYTRAAMDFIQASDDQPFFVYLPYTMPHTPLFRSEAFVGRSLGGRYGDVIEELDWSVGELVKLLQDEGFDDNTLLIFTSDNGPWLSMGIEGGRAGLLNNGKGTTFEGGMRVPAYFWWPGKIRPGVVSEIGSTLDFFRTITTLAGARADSGVDSLDISGTLFTQAPSPRKEISYYRSGELRAFRQGDWKIHLVTEGAYGLPPERRDHATPVLHNLKSDPSERFDIGADQPEVLARLQKAAMDHVAAVKKKPPAYDARLRR